MMRRNGSLSVAKAVATSGAAASTTPAWCFQSASSGGSSANISSMMMNTNTLLVSSQHQQQQQQLRHFSSSTQQKGRHLRDMDDDAPIDLEEPGVSTDADGSFEGVEHERTSLMREIDGTTAAAAADSPATTKDARRRNHRNRTESHAKIGGFSWAKLRRGEDGVLPAFAQTLSRFRKGNCVEKLEAIKTQDEMSKVVDALRLAVLSHRVDRRNASNLLPIDDLQEVLHAFQVLIARQMAHQDELLQLRSVPGVNAPKTVVESREDGGGGGDDAADSGDSKVDEDVPPPPPLVPITKLNTHLPYHAPKLSKLGQGENHICFPLPHHTKTMALNANKGEASSTVAAEAGDAASTFSFKFRADDILHGKPLIEEQEFTITVEHMVTLLTSEWPTSLRNESRSIAALLYKHVECECIFVINTRRALQSRLLPTMRRKGKADKIKSKKLTSYARRLINATGAFHRDVNQLASIATALSRYMHQNDFARSQLIKEITMNAEFLNNDGVAELSKLCKVFSKMSNMWEFYDAVAPRVRQAFMDVEGYFTAMHDDCKLYDSIQGPLRKWEQQALLPADELQQRSRQQQQPMYKQVERDTPLDCDAPLSFAVIYRFVQAYHKAIPDSSPIHKSTTSVGVRVLLNETNSRISLWPAILKRPPSDLSGLELCCAYTFVGLEYKNIARLIEMSQFYSAARNMQFTKEAVEWFLVPYFLNSPADEFTLHRRTLRQAMTMIPQEQNFESYIQLLDASVAVANKLGDDARVLLIGADILQALIPTPRINTFSSSSSSSSSPSSGGGRDGQPNFFVSVEGLGPFLKTYLQCASKYAQFLLPSQMLEIAELLCKVRLELLATESPLPKMMLQVLEVFAESFLFRVGSGTIDIATVELLLTSGFGTKMITHEGLRQMARWRVKEKLAEVDASKCAYPFMAKLHFANIKLRCSQAINAGSMEAVDALANRNNSATFPNPQRRHTETFLKPSTKQLWEMLELYNQRVFLYKFPLSDISKAKLSKAIEQVSLYEVVLAVSMYEQDSDAASRKTTAPEVGGRHKKKIVAINDDLVAEQEETISIIRSRHFFTEEIQTVLLDVVERRLQKLKVHPHQRKALLIGNSQHADKKRLGSFIGMIQTSPLLRLRSSPQLLEELLRLAEDEAPEQIEGLSLMLMECGQPMRYSI